MTTQDDWLSPKWQAMRGRKPICEELIQALREKPMTVAQLVEKTNAKESEIRKALTTNEWTVFKRVKGDGADVWDCRL